MAHPAHSSASTWVGVGGLGFGVRGVGLGSWFGVWGVGFGVWGLECGV